MFFKYSDRSMHLYLLCLTPTLLLPYPSILQKQETPVDVVIIRIFVMHSLANSKRQRCAYTKKVCGKKETRKEKQQQQQTAHRNAKWKEKKDLQPP